MCLLTYVVDLIKNLGETDLLFRSQVFPVSVLQTNKSLRKPIKTLAIRNRQEINVTLTSESLITG